MTSSNTTTFTMPSDREIVITRVFDAPRRLMQQGFTGTFDQLAEYLAKK